MFCLKKLKASTKMIFGFSIVAIITTKRIYIESLCKIIAEIPAPSLSHSLTYSLEVNGVHFKWK